MVGWNQAKLISSQQNSSQPQDRISCNSYPATGQNQPQHLFSHRNTSQPQDRISRYSYPSARTRVSRKIETATAAMSRSSRQIFHFLGDSGSERPKRTFVRGQVEHIISCCYVFILDIMTNSDNVIQNFQTGESKRH